MKRCSLCCATASVHCESDKAILCWDCDAKVHGANFLVARHSRYVLCRGCSVPTPWTASGPRLCPSVSVCDRCRLICDGELTKMDFERGSGAGGGDDDDDLGDSDDDDFEDDDDDDLGVSADDMEDDEEENQVVPWWTGSAAWMSPATATSYSSGDESTRMGIHDRAFRRTGDNDDFRFSTSRHLHHPSPKAPPSGSLAGERATSFPARVPNEVARPGLTLTPPSCRGNYSPSPISQI